MWKSAYVGVYQLLNFHLIFIYLVKKEKYKFRTIELHLIWIFFSELGNRPLYPLIANVHYNFILAEPLSLKHDEYNYEITYDV